MYRDTIEIASILAVCIFNEGFYSVLRIMALMAINIGQQAEIFAEFQNAERIGRSERKSKK